MILSSQVLRGSETMSVQDRGRTFCIIGIGNEYRNDDAAGLLVARQLRECRLEGVDIRELSGDGSDLMEAWNTKSKVYL